MNQRMALRELLLAAADALLNGDAVQRLHMADRLNRYYASSANPDPVIIEVRGGAAEVQLPTPYPVVLRDYDLDGVFDVHHTHTGYREERYDPK